LGDAIIDNKTLNTLIVSNNSIDSAACFTICIGAIENSHLVRLNLNGNPIGEQGAKALMFVPVSTGGRIKMSASGCNITRRDSKCWFDMSNTVGKYELELRDPFDRAVLFALLRMVANHPTQIFKSFDLQIGNKRESLNLIQVHKQY